MMKYFSTKIALLGILLGAGIMVNAAEQERTFLVVELSKGQTESVMLSNEDEKAMPLWRHKEGILVLNGTPYNTADIVGMRLETRMVDAIEEVSNDAQTIQPAGTTAIYDLSGRKIVNSKIVNGQFVNGALPKGIYIINGKKVVLR